ncbi:UvrD-helicase-domain-containing protein [Cantharellus anzutake]|uniref:UvrD-helicase-domain-containing protein n=1 Tax=Cantharellus anzutake TaxID=1750568 RepID=UPI0019049A17|nr:UvrD-helicase-domain-containing protein [Cantharellus anzutake]KAF8339859.1 UvrD-helicase-domain-containing protein [Cantharellus anzutake]
MSYLEGMNEAQRQAVTHDPLIPLQILAGPGSGKTKVLTARIAHLVGHHKIAPQAIVAVTFTNKAAKEMRERLKKLIGDGKTSMLRMGTFHALCAKYLRIYGKRIFLPENFSICDADETKKIIKKLLKLPKHADVIANKRLHAEPRIIASFISKAKANGQSPEDVKSLIQSGDDKDIDFESVVAEIYSDYSEELRVTNCLDFDDLLMYGVKLFLKARDIGLKIRHVLVDEFQDTNVIQFQLMTLLASTKGVSIVGDPDQSIYGWRSADIENLSKMQTLFPETQQIYLEQNYRSTGSILAAASVIISGDKSRIQKTLFTAEQDGSKPTLREVAGENMEAECIAYEIKRLIAYSGGLLDYNDFAILLRFNALSRILEQVLQREGIPVRILGGHRFFDRMEVKDLISYLQLVDNPHNWFAFERAVNVPKRGMGDKSVQEILKRASAIGITPMDLCQRIVSGKAADIKPAVKRKITPFVDVIDTLSRLAVNEEYSAEELVLRLVAMIGYEEWLKTSQPADWEARWENVRELIKFAGESLRSESPQVEPQPTVTADNRRTSLIQNAETISPHRRSESNSHLEGDVIEENRSVTPLRKFLEDTSLLSDPDEEGRQEQEDQDKNSVPKVTISTCHSAKGLEWPVVFLPAVENWVFPFYKSEDVDEERRLLYVGCTRAQAFLYVSYCRDRDLQWLSRSSGPSPFLLLNRAKHVTNTAFSPKTPPLTMDEMALTSKILKRPPIDIITSRDRIQEFHKKIHATRPRRKRKRIA